MIGVKERKDVENKTIYDVQNSILKKDFIPTDDEIKLLNSFMLCRWLSNHPFSIEVANYINSHHNLSLESQYWLARSLVHNVKYIAFQKREKEDTSYIEYICLEYKCNEVLAKRYVNMLPKTELERIKEKYTRGGRAK